VKNHQHAGQLHVTEQRLLTLQLRGELAEDSLDVPSYIAALSSGVIIYAWLSELSNCPAAIAKIQKERVGSQLLSLRLLAAQFRWPLKKIIDRFYPTG
jgi:hypothetical protein